VIGLETAVGSCESATSAEAFTSSVEEVEDCAHNLSSASVASEISSALRLRLCVVVDEVLIMSLIPSPERGFCVAALKFTALVR
jgi:type VI protein secretion system component VasF